MSITYLNICGREYEIADTSQPKSACSKWCDKNVDIILIVMSILFATCAVLAAYRYFPNLTEAKSMYAAGCFATGSAFAFTFGIMNALRSRGCIVQRPRNSLPIAPSS